MKLNGRWFPQIIDRDSGNLYPIYIKQKLWCWLLNLLAGDLGDILQNKIFVCLLFCKHI